MANRKSHHTNIVIRRATGDDVDAIADIHVASWQTAYRGILAEDDMAAWGQTEAALWVLRDNTAARRFYELRAGSRRLPNSTRSSGARRLWRCSTASD